MSKIEIKSSDLSLLLGALARAEVGAREDAKTWLSLNSKTARDFRTMAQRYKGLRQRLHKHTS